MLGSPCWTRTNDRRLGHGRIACASACNARCPCPFSASLYLPQAALDSEPVNSRDTAAPQRRWPTSSRKTKTKHRVKRCFAFGSPCWTRTNDRRLGHGRIACASACNARCPCPFSASLYLPQAALDSEPVNSRDTAAPQRRWPTSSRKTKTKHRVKRCFAFGSPCWTRTNDTAVNSRMLYQCKGYKPE